jgi:hypothetical protein
VPTTRALAAPFGLPQHLCRAAALIIINIQAPEFYARHG